MRSARSSSVPCVTMAPPSKVIRCSFFSSSAESHRIVVGFLASGFAGAALSACCFGGPLSSLSRSPFFRCFLLGAIGRSTRLRLLFCAVFRFDRYVDVFQKMSAFFSRFDQQPGSVSGIVAAFKLDQLFGIDSVLSLVVMQITCLERQSFRGLDYYV